MQNAVPKAFRTPFLKSSKTKTKTKYLILTSGDQCRPLFLAGF
jgi:hypothetical protein